MIHLLLSLTALPLAVGPGICAVRNPPSRMDLGDSGEEVLDKSTLQAQS